METAAAATTTTAAPERARAWVPVDDMIARARAGQATTRPAARVQVLPRSRVVPAVATAVYLCRAVLDGHEEPAALELAIRVLLEAVAPPTAPQPAQRQPIPVRS